MTTRRYFPSFVLDPAEEIDPVELHEHKSYVAADYKGDHPLVAVLHRDGHPVKVLYPGRTWPEPDLMAEHRQNYGDLPWRIVSPQMPMGENFYQDDWFGTKDGYVGQERTILTQDGDVLAQHTIDPDGKIAWSIVYTYDDEGNLKQISEIAPDGTIVSQDDCDD